MATPCRMLTASFALLIIGNILPVAQAQPPQYRPHSHTRPLTSPRHGNPISGSNQAGNEENNGHDPLLWVDFLSDNSVRGAPGTGGSMAVPQSEQLGDEGVGNDAEEGASSDFDAGEPFSIWTELWIHDRQEILKAFRTIFPNPKPRGFFDALFKASRSTSMGFFLGMTSFVLSLPVSALTFVFFGWKVSLGSVLTGLALTTGSIASGMSLGLAHCIEGLCQWPKSLEARFSGKAWNPRDGRYVMYDLDRDQIHLQALQEDRRRRLIDSNTKEEGYYEILGVSPDCTYAELRRAYRRAAQKLHPDKQKPEGARQNASRSFEKLQLAYRTLSKPSARKIYDEWGDLIEYLDKLPTFDPSLFLSMLFQSSQLEPYVGQLQLISWGEYLFYLMLHAHREAESQNKGRSNIGHITTIRKVIEFMAWMPYLENLRQANIASHLRRCTELYDRQPLGMFQDWCDAEALRLVAQADTDLLQAVGKGLLRASNPVLTFRWFAPWTWPLGLISWLHGIGARLFKRCRVVAGILQFTKASVFLDACEHSHDERNFYAMISKLARSAFDFNYLDVSSAVEGASWKLLQDTSVERETRKSRAVAIQILGEAFIIAAKTKQYERGDTNKAESSETAAADRIRNAWKAASKITEDTPSQQVPDSQENRS